MEDSRAVSPSQLSQRTFPVPFESNEDASSVISSNLSDVGHGERPTRSASRTNGWKQRYPLQEEVRGVTGPPGEAGLPPSRPVDNIFATLSGQHLQQDSIGSFAGSYSSENRPATSSTTTHVPSLTSSAFLRPMSSQRLQAYRAQKPDTLPIRRARVSEDFDEDASDANRNSTGSALTIRGGLALPSRHDLNTMPCRTSEGIAYSEWFPSQHTDGNISHAEVASLQGRAEYHEQPPLMPSLSPHLNDEKGSWNGSATIQPSPKLSKSPTRSSPKNLVHGFRRSSRSNSVHPDGHEKLSSRESSPHLTKDSHQLTRQDAGRNWEYYPGKTMFCFGGRLQTTRGKPITIITGTLVILPAVLFFIFPAPWLWHHVSPAIPILFAYLFYLCMSSYLHASLSDPGILPRNLHRLPLSNPNDDPLTLGPPTTEWTMVFSAVAQHGAFEVPTKYCESCNIWRPPRCHHCRACDSCVDTQDHHCMWLNNCVGRRNYRYFFTFISSGTLLGIWLLASCIGQVISYRNYYGISTDAAISQNRVSFAMFIYGILAFGYPATLWVYHVYLIARGQTTREYLNSHKFLKQDRHRPFSQKSWWQNWVIVLQRPRPPTYMDFREKYQEGDQRFGERRGHRNSPLATKKRLTGVEMQHFPHMSPSFQGPTSRRTEGFANEPPRMDFAR